MSIDPNSIPISGFEPVSAGASREVSWSATSYSGGFTRNDGVGGSSPPAHHLISQHNLPFSVIKSDAEIRSGKRSASERAFRWAGRHVRYASHPIPNP